MNKIYFRKHLVLTSMIFLITVITHAQLNPLIIGTIPPGDSVVIKYSVTINNPLVPPTTSQITNQGTVSGSNFSNILTDDPDTGTGNDPTITFLNVYTLPLTLLEFKANLNGSVVYLFWKVTDEFNVEKYEIERSKSPSNFEVIAHVNSLNTATVKTYQINDNNLLPDGDYYYRLRMIDLDGKYSYSPVVRISFKDGNALLNTFPNPVTNRVFSLYMQRLPKARYRVELFNNSGQEVFYRMIDHPGGTATQIIQLPQTISGGPYRLVVIDEKGAVKFSQAIIVQ